MAGENTGRDSTRDAGKQSAGRRYERIHRTIARVFDEHPRELSIIRAHLAQRQLERGPLATMTADASGPQALVRVADQHRAVLVALSEADECRAALQAMDATYRRLAGDAGDGDTEVMLFIAVPIGIAIGIGLCWAFDCWD